MSAVSALLLWVHGAIAGQFGVSPIRLDLDRGAKTGAVTISNDETDKPLQVQMKLFAWTQDADGKDQYEESGDLTFFPRMMTLPPQEQRLLRAGIRLPPGTTERSYRLFVEEIPEPGKGTAAGAQVSVAIRFGVPIFVGPLKENAQGMIDKAAVTKGTLQVLVRNTGNVHFMIQTLTARSGDTFNNEVSGWYLLPGASRNHSISIPKDVCLKLSKVDVTVKTDKLELTRSVDIDKSMCS
jgi:fimbrial chaperone protein